MGLDNGLTKVDDGREEGVPMFRCGRAIGMLCPMNYSVLRIPAYFHQRQEKVVEKWRGEGVGLGILVFGLTSEADERSFRLVGITRIMLNFTK